MLKCFAEVVSKASNAGSKSNAKKTGASRSSIVSRGRSLFTRLVNAISSIRGRRA